MIGMPTTAVRTRTVRFERPLLFAGGVSDMHAALDERGHTCARARSRAWYSPEAPIARLERSDRFVEIALAVLRPERVAEVELRVGGAPEQEVADPDLAAGADEEIDR